MPKVREQPRRIEPKTRKQREVAERLDHALDTAVELTVHPGMDDEGNRRRSRKACLAFVKSLSELLEGNYETHKKQRAAEIEEVPTLDDEPA